MKPNWGAAYIGKGWAPNAEGPEDFFCWGLVREVFRVEHSIELPFVAVGDETADNVRAIKQAAEVSGLRRVHRAPHDGEIVVLTSTREIHAGLACELNGRMGLLESAQGRGVTWSPWREVVQGNFELWGWQ
jgi:hypothetical protein